MGKIYCDIATATDTEIWELDADITGKFGSTSAVGAGSASNPWKIAIVGSLRADVIPQMSASPPTTTRTEVHKYIRTRY